MSRFKKAALAIMGFIAIGVFTAASAPQEYLRYCNRRFGFCLNYPADFELDPAPISDGLAFRNPDGFRMFVSGANNVRNKTLSDEYESDKKGFDSLAFQDSGDNWYILNGKAGSKIVYLKTYWGKGSLNQLYIGYPEQLKDRYDKIVAFISRSFVPGNVNVAH
jgi:hypothetical protein